MARGKNLGEFLLCVVSGLFVSLIFQVLLSLPTRDLNTQDDGIVVAYKKSWI